MGERNNLFQVPSTLPRHLSRAGTESNQSERELHLTLAPASNPRTCLRLRHPVQPQPTQSWFRSQTPGGRAHSERLWQRRSVPPLELLTAVRAPLLRRRLRKSSASPLGLQVPLAPKDPRVLGSASTEFRALRGSGDGNPDCCSSTYSL